MKAGANPDHRELHIAEIPYESGQVRYHYARYLSADGSVWIRHGLFRAYYEDGTLASEGHYEHGQESGLWRDYHANGQLAAEGEYVLGLEHGIWKYWNPNGTLESETLYVEGKES
jgi:antitoxin component YwqK of YwqJK toxin-antitoxin module